MKKKFSLVELLVVISCIAILATIALPTAIPNAVAQIDAFFTEVLTTSVTAVTANATTTVTTEAIPVRGDAGVGLFAKFKLAGAGTGNMTFNFAGSYDGTNWTTTTPWTAAVAANGTNSVRAFVTFTPETSPPLKNVRYIRLASVANANATNGTIEEIRTSLYNR